MAASRRGSNGDGPVRHGGKVLVHEHLTLRDVDALGRGWFAQCDLPAGTILWKEKPITVGRNRADLVRRVHSNLEKHAAFCRPTDSEADSEAEGIVRCNYFDNGRYVGAMLFEHTSLLNHSCSPNVSVRMILSEFGACYSQVQTARPISVGEQLFITYSASNLFMPSADRPCQVWGFEPACPRCSCTLPAAEQELWALLEAAAGAADAAKKLPIRSSEAVMAALPLQRSAAEALACSMPCLAEGDRFAEDVSFFRGLIGAVGGVHA
jgi:hypothetical protein